MSCILWDSWCVPAPASLVWAVEALQARYAAAETRSGLVLDHERGNLEGARVALGGEAGGFSGAVELETLAGRLAYQGQSQIGIPLSTLTHLGLDDARLAVGPAAVHLGAGDAVQLQGGLQQLRIERHILATPLSGGLDETLRSRSTFVRVAWQHAAGAYPAVSLDASALYARSRTQSLQVDTLGVFDPLTLHPAAGREGSFEAGCSFEFAPAWQLRVAAGYTQWRFDPAAPQLATRGGLPAAVASYPGSMQRTNRLAISMSHRL